MLSNDPISGYNFKNILSQKCHSRNITDISVSFIHIFFKSLYYMYYLDVFFSGKHTKHLKEITSSRLTSLNISQSTIKLQFFFNIHASSSYINIEVH